MSLLLRYTCNNLDGTTEHAATETNSNNTNTNHAQRRDDVDSTQSRRDRKALIDQMLVVKKFKQIGLHNVNGDEALSDNTKQQRSQISAFLFGSSSFWRKKSSSSVITLDTSNNNNNNNNGTKHSNADHLDISLTCPICLCEYKDGDTICFSLNKSCRHFFHHACVEAWLMGHDECPCCRANYLSLGSAGGNDDDEEAQRTQESSSSSSIPTLTQLDTTTATSTITTDNTSRIIGPNQPIPLAQYVHAVLEWASSPTSSSMAGAQSNRNDNYGTSESGNIGDGYASDSSEGGIITDRRIIAAPRQVGYHYHQHHFMTSAENNVALPSTRSDNNDLSQDMSGSHNVIQALSSSLDDSNNHHHVNMGITPIDSSTTARTTNLTNVTDGVNLISPRQQGHRLANNEPITGSIQDVLNLHLLDDLRRVHSDGNIRYTF